MLLFYFFKFRSHLKDLDMELLHELSEDKNLVTWKRGKEQEQKISSLIFPFCEFKLFCHTEQCILLKELIR
jgi:hypothetical protein